MEDTAKAMEEMTKFNKEMAESMNDLKETVKNLTVQNESMQTEMKTLSTLKKDNDYLKKEIHTMRFELFTMLQQIQENQGSQPSHQQQNKQQQQQQQKDQVVVFTPTCSLKWSNLSMVADIEKKDLQFFMHTRTLSSFKYEFNESIYAHRFVHHIRPDETLYKKDYADDGIANTCSGTFTAPMFGRYRFNVKGNIYPEYGDFCAVEKWYICYIRKEDDIFDEDNPENERSCDNEDNREAREKRFLQEVKKQLLFTIGDEEGSEATKEVCIAVDCDKDVRFWVEMENENIDDIVGVHYCTFNGRFIR